MPRHGGSAWPIAGFVLIGVFAIRTVWLAAAFYFGGRPRFPLESAAIALVIVGTFVVLLRRGESPKGDRNDREPHQRAVPLAWMAAFVAASIVIFAPTLGLGLLSDDYVLRAHARAGTLAWTPASLFRPLPLIVWRLLLGLYDSAVFLHALNVLLHGLNASLVAALAVRLGQRREAALAAGALFVAFPAAAEAVAWCSGIQDVLLTSCALGAVLAAGGASARSTAVAASLTVAGLGSKETAICIPVLIMLCWFGPSVWRRRERLLPAAFPFGIVILYGLARISMGIEDRYAAAPSQYLAKQMLVTAFGTLAVPFRVLSPAPRHWLGFGTSVVLTALLVHAFATWRRQDASFNRAVRLAAWVIAAVGPVYTFFFVSTELEGSRYVYLAACGWALLLVDLMSTASRRAASPTLALTAGAAVAVAVSVLLLEGELRVWSRAAALRDQVLLEARASAERAGCVTARFAGVPDSVEGVFVFRNGFSEAVREMGITVDGAATFCDFKWSGSAFVTTSP